MLSFCHRGGFEPTPAGAIIFVKNRVGALKLLGGSWESRGPSQRLRVEPDDAVVLALLNVGGRHMYLGGNPARMIGGVLLNQYSPCCAQFQQNRVFPSGEIMIEFKLIFSLLGQCSLSFCET